MEPDHKYIYLYSCEKKDKIGCGVQAVRVDFTDSEDFERQKEILKQENKIINQKWRAENPLKTPKKEKGTKQIKKDMAPVPRKHNYGANYIDLDISNNVVNSLPDLMLDHPLIGNEYQPGSGNSICLIGSSKSGKSTILKAIYNKYFKETPKKRNLISMLFSVNSHATVYNDMPGVLKINKFDRNGQKMINQLKKVNMLEKNKYNYLVMLDDIVDSKYSNILNQLILTYRNSNFNSIISVQQDKLISKCNRSSINNVILGACNTDEAIESIVKSFLSSKFYTMGYKTLPSQVALYKQLTQDYTFLYYFSRKDQLIRFKLNLS